MEQTREEIQFTKMTETPVPSLILRLAVPTTISMLITGIYNTADTYFVSQISVSASAATGVVFSLMAILQAFGFMYGHGAGSNVSRLLGAKKPEHASIFASTSFFLAMATGALICIFGLIFLEPFMYLLGSTDTILPEAKAYARYILLAGPAMTCGCVLNNILRYEGRASFAMIGLTTGGILNMLLDPLFIFVFDLGTAGAGSATMVSQYISLFILLVPFLRGQTASKISLRSFTKSFDDVKNIIYTGLPNLARQGLNSISTTILNLQAAAYGDAAIASFSIVTRCANLIFSFAIGIAQGFQPVCAFNFGAKRKDRVRTAYLFTMGLGVSIIAILNAVCFFLAPDIISLFREDPEVIETGTQALRLMCFGLVFLPASALGSMLFQSVGYKRQALLLSLLQSGIIFIPLLLILPYIFGLKGIEVAQPAAYLIAFLIAFPMSLRFLKKLNSEVSV